MVKVTSSCCCPFAKHILCGVFKSSSSKKLLDKYELITQENIFIICFVEFLCLYWLSSTFYLLKAQLINVMRFNSWLQYWMSDVKTVSLCITIQYSLHYSDYNLKVIKWSRWLNILSRLCKMTSIVYRCKWKNWTGNWVHFVKRALSILWFCVKSSSFELSADFINSTQLWHVTTNQSPGKMQQIKTKHAERK